MKGNSLDIAVVGMACVFPQATNPAQFWENLCNGVETIKFLTDEELLERGVSKELLQQPNYVKAASVLENPESFDAEFFGINPNEARSMDPQHRIFLETCWEALEDAGYDPAAYEGDIGVFAGLGMNSYLFDVLGKNPEYLESISQEQIMIGNDKDYLPTRVSYKLNLTGPSVNINTACSTSLVAIHLARQSLLLGESDMVLAGGVSVFLPGSKGYLYVQDSIQSPDGHCRAFDEQAKGTVWGDGCGVVVLKRLDDAQRDGDHIYAVVKGAAVNNDGSLKVGYTAPSVEAQSRVIVEALAVADLSPEQISYVEAHGTGTQLGDPIEVAALTEAFRSETDKTGFCPIGSVKTNIGHTNSAAGIAGFIKTVLALHHGQLPPSLHFDKPNPKINFADSPFYVNTKLTEWKRGVEPLRAGISSMGIGGTNCHVIVEEAPVVTTRADQRVRLEAAVLVLSARSAKALEEATNQLADHLADHPELALEDVAYTLQCGRRAFGHRRAIICRSLTDAIQIMRLRDPKFMLDSSSPHAMDQDIPHADLLASWLKGEDVDWFDAWRGLSPSRVSLPTYPFERKRYWVEPTATEPDRLKASLNDEAYFKKVPDMADWFYVPAWKQAPLSFAARNRSSKSRLVFVDTFQIGQDIVPQLAAIGNEIITVAKGKSYKQESATSFVLNPTDPEGFEKLLGTLQEAGQLPESILFLWSLETVPKKAKLDWDSLIAGQEHGFFSILHLAKALDKLGLKHPMEFLAVTNNAFDVIGSEEMNLNAGTIYGMCLVMQQAYDNITSRVIDIVLPKASDAQRAKLLDALLTEICQEPADLLCAYRGNKRYVRHYDPIRVEEDVPVQHPIREDGVYLMYSGLEGVGVLVSEHIVRKGGKLLILEEEGFPEVAQWDTWMAKHDEDDLWSSRMTYAKQLLADGAEYVGTLSSRHEDNQRLLAEIETRFGSLAGVIHSPSVSNAKRARAIKGSTPDTWIPHFKEVSFSMILLDQMLKGKTLDFRIMLSSLGSVLGGDGFINIATVTNHAKSYLYMQGRTDEQLWQVQCWDSWTIEWTLVGKYLPPTVYKRVEPSVLTHDEGLKCFERTFCITNFIELDISSTNLYNRYDKWIKLSAMQKYGSEGQAGLLLHQRPELATDYVAPKSPTEQALAKIFTELLGIEEVGVDDNFFELGGHSLLGVQLASKIRKQYAVDLDLYYIYNFPTISSLAGYLESEDRMKLVEDLINSRWQ